jgi:ABC-type amino acid transport substrate-binding protein
MQKYRIISIVLIVLVAYLGVCVAGDNQKKLHQVRIVTTEEPPTNYTYQGKFSGTTTDIVEEIKKYLNINAKIEVKPWVRSYKIAKTEPDVVIFTAGRSQERIDYGFHFIGPVITRKHVLWRKKGDSLGIKSIQDIKAMDLKIGSMRGDWRTKFFKNQGIQVQEVANHELNLKKLLKGRFHLWVSSDIEAPPILNKLGYDMNEIEIEYIFKEASSYIMLSRDSSKDFVEKWKNAYAQIQKTDFFEKASKKWSQILGFELGFTKEKGFFVKQ